MSPIDLEIPVASVIVGDRLRGVSKGTVRALVDSIRDQGLLQPIGVKEQKGKYKLIWGAHRLDAFRTLNRSHIPAFVYPENLSDRDLQLAEIQENFARRELTGAQRQQFASKILRLGSQADSGTLENFQKDWMKDLAEKISVSRRAVQNWWSDFIKETQTDIKPAKASKDDRERFGVWLSDRQRREDEEKARKAETAKAHRQEEAKENFLYYVEKIISEWGVETVSQWFEESLTTLAQIDDPTND